MKIFCVENNYPLDGKVPLAADGSAAPIVCLKADSSLLKGHKPFFVPDFMGRIGYGGAVVVRISRLGKSIASRFAHRYYDALTMGVDFTALDVLQQCKAEGLPWDVAKGFDGAAVIGDWVEAAKFRDVQGVHFSLSINGNTVQDDCTSNMLHRIDDLIAHVSRFYTLKMGDLLFTGTPCGYGEVHIGDRIEGYLEDRPVLSFLCK